MTWIFHPSSNDFKKLVLNVNANIFNKFFFLNNISFDSFEVSPIFCFKLIKYNIYSRFSLAYLYLFLFKRGLLSLIIFSFLKFNIFFMRNWNFFKIIIALISIIINEINENKNINWKCNCFIPSLFKQRKNYFIIELAILFDIKIIIFLISK